MLDLIVSDERQETKGDPSVTQGQEPESDFVELGDIARRYGVSVETVRRWCQKRMIPGAVKVGKLWRIPRKWMVESLDFRFPDKDKDERT